MTKRPLSKGAVIVETRQLPNFSEVVHNHMKYLGKDWGLRIYCGAENWQYITEQCIGLKYHAVQLPVTTLDFRAYNELMANWFFWNGIPFDKVLIFQHDSRLLRSGIDEFLQWDYVGSPWTFQQHGGNGGLSLRTRDVMLKIIENHKYSQKRNEDVYFCEYVDKYGKLAPRQVCEQFSCEAIFRLGTLGYHAIDKYLTKEECSQIINQKQ